MTKDTQSSPARWTHPYSLLMPAICLTAAFTLARRKSGSHLAALGPLRGQHTHVTVTDSSLSVGRKLLWKWLCFLSLNVWIAMDFYGSGCSCLSNNHRYRYCELSLLEYNIWLKLFRCEILNMQQASTSFSVTRLVTRVRACVIFHVRW